MASTQWTLIDTEQGEYVESLDLTEQDLSQWNGRFRMSKRRLRGGLQEGVEWIRLECGDLAVVVLPSRGMNLWKAWRGSHEFGWKSPVRGPVHPQFVPLHEPGGLGFLDGFDELFARCGLESNGAPEFDPSGRLQYTLHGRISNRPAHSVIVAVDDDAGTVSLTGTVEETRFLFFKLRLTTTIKLNLHSNAIEIHDQIENAGGKATQAQMLYHVNFSDPLLGKGAVLSAPIESIVPRNSRAVEGLKDWHTYGEPTSGFEEQVYFMKLFADRQHQSQTMLRSADNDVAAGLRFGVDRLPCFTLWKNTAAHEDGYVTGLEPGTNFPNPRSFETTQGRVIDLEPGAIWSNMVMFDLLLGQNEISGYQDSIDRLQGDRSTQVFEKPQPGWCAGV